MTAAVRYRENDPVAEPVIRLADIFACDAHAAARLFAGAKSQPLEMFRKRVPAVRCIAEAERFDGCACQAAAVQIGAGGTGCSRSQGFGEKRLGRFMQCEKSFTLAFALWVWCLAPGQLDTGFAREALNGFRERKPLRLHEESENISVLAACETVIEALLIVDEKRRRLLGLERR